jgi:hypothetical protein
LHATDRSWDFLVALATRWHVAMIFARVATRPNIGEHLLENQTMDQSRRNMLRLGGAALAMIPVIALAAKNDAMRTSMKYKDTPDGDKSCSSCIQFVPGKTPADKGGCKIFPGDTEVSPKGFCVAWAKKA